MDKKTLINSTLVPLDFSETSMNALEHASAIAHLSQDNKKNVVALLHIIEGGHFEPVYDKSELNTHDRDALAIEGAFNRMAEITKTYAGKYDVEFHCIVAAGKPYRTITDVAEEVNAQCIVMGSHGSSGLQALAGSNASRVIQVSPCPVVVVKHKPLGNGYKNIVLPLDLSRESKQKVNIATMVAKYFNSTVHIVAPEIGNADERRHLQANLNQVEEYLKERNIATDTTLLNEDNGNFAMQMIVWAQGKDADLIIIMAEDEKGFSEYIFGTMAQQVVNRSTLPVMAVTPNEKFSGFFSIM
ncbi:MAG: universal stress protein [Bacteroidetes bacterium]|nr:universal stress protein [Bacteroidota bacterium]